LLSFFKNIVGSGIPDMHIPELGRLKYDKKEECWEVVDNPKDINNGLELGYAVISGTTSGPSKSNIEAFLHYIKNTDSLWDYADKRFLNMASKHISNIDHANIKDNFYIRSLTLTNQNEFEVGFHARNIDVFIELFVRGGMVINLEEDIGCCAV
jgi:hypothetical protein